MITAYDAERVAGAPECELLARLSGSAVLRTRTKRVVSRRTYRWCPIEVVEFAAGHRGVTVTEVVKAFRDLVLVESVMLS